MADDAASKRPKTPPEEEKSEVDIAEERQAKSISELESELAAPLSTPAEPKKPSKEGMNLSSLRDRVMHESIVIPEDPEITAAPEIPQKAEAVPVSSTPFEPVLSKAEAQTEAQVQVPKSEPKVQTTFKITPLKGAEEREPTIAPESVAVPTSPPTPSTAESPDMHALEKQPDAKNPFTGVVRPLRTFRDDIAQVVERRKISLVSALAAEEDQRSQQKASAASTPRARSFSPGAYFMLGMSVVFLAIGGLVLGGYFAFFEKEEAIGVPKAVLPSIVFTEMQTQIDVSNMGRDDLMSALSAEKDRISLRLGAMTAVYPIASGPEGWRLLAANELFDALESRAPLPLVRALSPFFMFGIHEFDGNEPFFIFKTEVYDNAFAGMLEWEPLMSIDLSPLFGRVSLTRALTPIEAPESAPLATTSTSSTQIASSTSTTTETVPGIPPSDGFVTIGEEDNTVQTDGGPRFGAARFEDAVIRNKEVRVLKNDEGKIVLLYSFIDPSTIVITTNEYTFIEILTRYASKRF